MRAMVMALWTHKLRACRVTVPPFSRRLITKVISLRVWESLAMRTVALAASPVKTSRLGSCEEEASWFWGLGSSWAGALAAP